MRERGRYQVQFMKTRSSSGVGSKVDLEFNVDTLRISDLPDGAEGADSAAAAGLLTQLKNRGTIKAEEPKQQETVNKALQLSEFLKKK